PLVLLTGVLAVWIAVIIDASRGRLARNWVRYLGSVLVLLAGIAGMVLSHPTLLFTLLWVCAPGIAVVVFRLVRRLWRVWPRSRIRAAALFMAALGAVD